MANLAAHTASEQRYQPLPGLVLLASIVKIPWAVSTWRVNWALAKRRRHMMHMRTGPCTVSAVFCPSTTTAPLRLRILVGEHERRAESGDER